MYIKIRKFGDCPGENDLIITLSKTDSISEIKKQIEGKWDYKSESQRLFYKGKQLSDEYRVFDYEIQLNDVVQLMLRTKPVESEDDNNKSVEIENECSQNESEEHETNSKYYRIDDLVDIRDVQYGAWFEAKIVNIKIGSIVNGESSNNEHSLKFFVKLESEQHSDPFSVKFSDIRPRASYTYDFSELSVGDLVMVNYNIEKPAERGFWYDMKIQKISNKAYKSLTGTIYVGKGEVPLDNCKVKFVTEVMRIEKPSLLSENETRESVNIQPRKMQHSCKNCKDVLTKNCKECGCHICGRKNDPGTILLCDECDYGYHISCLNPPLEKIPNDSEWYCPSCKNDENEIVKIGDKLKFSNRKSKMASTVNDAPGRDWGRGMACVGRTKECTIVPKDHYGPIPGVEVGTCWKFRLQVSEAGIHRPHVAGIHGRETDGAYSLVLSGGYEDDVDNGEEFYYTGSGGRDLSGNKRLAEQSCDQTLTRMNKALAMNCNAKFNPKDGAEATDWRNGKPVRVVRNYKLSKHSKYAPKDGNRYDGLYKIVKYYPEKGKAGFIVWRYLLRRDDPTPAPWMKGGQEFDMIYPVGYLEAHSNTTENSSESQKKVILKRPLKDKSNEENNKKVRLEPYKLSSKIKKFIENDAKNEKLWNECTEKLELGKQAYLSKVQDMFMCICCQEIVYNPVTTECNHNICIECLKRSFSSEIYTCPYCRYNLGEDYILKINQDLSDALLVLFPGYESGR